MSVVFSYSLAVSVTLILGLLAYRLSSQNRIRFSFRRMTLIAIFVMSLALPLLPSMRSAVVQAEPPIAVGPAVIRIAPAPDEGGSDIWRMLLLLWGAGMAAVLLLNLISLLRIFLIIIRAERRNVYGRRIYITADKRIAPFSLGNIIVANRDDFDSDAGIILSHEAGHIHHRHTLDMFLSQAVITLCWYNPAAWMLRKELKTVHEYEADRYVIDRGNDTHEYQLFLVMRAARSTFPSIGSNLNKSRLKSRIRTMNSNSSLIPFSIMGLVVPAVAFIASFLLLSAPAVSAALRQSADVELMDAPTEPVNDFEEIKVIGVGTMKKISLDSLKTINADSIKSISVDRKAGKTEVVMKNETVVHFENRELQDTAVAKPAQEEMNGMKKSIIGSATVDKNADKEPVVIMANKELQEVHIYVNGLEVSEETISKLSPMMIESISVEKSGEKPCIRVSLKKSNE